MAAIFQNPATMYVGCAGLMFLSYSAAEGSSGNLSGSGTKFVMSMWSCISLITACIIMAVWSSSEVGTVDPQTMGFAVVLCILTLCVSSCVVKSAWS